MFLGMERLPTMEANEIKLIPSQAGAERKDNIIANVVIAEGSNHGYDDEESCFE